MESRNLFYYPEDGVRELTNKDFSVNGIGEMIVTHPAFVQNNGLIMFYAPWCGHCKKFRQEWSNIALKTGNVFPIASVNSERQYAAERVGVKSYPTIKYVHKDGTMTTYQGNRRSSDILDFVCKKANVCNL